MSSKIPSVDASYFGAEPDKYRMLRAEPLLYLRTVVVQFLQGLFWYLPRHHYHWEPNVEETEIVITDESPIKVKQYGTRPCISVTRSQVAFTSIGFDDMLSLDPMTGTKKKSVMVPGTLVFNCCSREPLESEGLAFFVAEHLWLLRDHLQRKSIHQIGQNISIGSPSPAGALVASDNGDEWTATSAAMPFQMTRTGAVTPLGSKISGDIVVALQNRLGAATGTSQTQQSQQTKQPQHPTSASNRALLTEPGAQVQARMRGRAVRSR